ncbi:unnamed protein product [Orchesella dallaii]|uniref:C2H2-type domain-containing protein n=1 Tax=Orchesella dallaii TaxID=48710 RepID=A0ABP1RED6_9HEXA
MDLKLRCSASGCECPNFGAAPSKETLRICDGCSHSWMTHLLEKLLTSRDDALSIFDVCSLALYGTHALPIRIKIVMERLLSTLQPEEVDKILRSFGWGVADLARGYMVQDPRSSTSTQSQSPPPPSSLFPHLNNNIAVMTRWTIIPRDEELLILQQFLRFPATRTLSFSLLRDEFPMNLNGMNSTLSMPTNFPPAPTPLKFNGLFGLGMNLIPGLGITPPPPPQNPPVKREVVSPPQNPQSRDQLSRELEYKKRKDNAALNLCSTDNHKNNGYEKHDRVVDLSCANNSIDKKLFNHANMITHDRSHVQNPSPKPKERAYEERKVSKQVHSNQVRKQPWEGRSRSPHHHHHGHHLNVSQQQPLPPSSSSSHNHLVPPPPPPPPPPPVNMAAAVAASAAAAVNAAAVSAQQLVNPVTGKRRVQCAVCLKTFCDKGALKIHFSAVHLREMHKCTVSGCNMMFSSRRSRNRHSANPNPKLHSPHLRRKISPHDGRTAQPLLLNNPMLYGHAAAAMAAMGRIPPGGGNPNNPFNNGFDRAIGKNTRKSGESGNSEQGARVKKEKGPTSNASDSEPEFPVPITMMMNSDDEDDSYMIHNGGSDDEEDDGTGIHIPDHMMMVMPPKNNKDQDSDSFSSTNEELNEKQVLSPEASVGRKEGSRKRKLTNPVRLPSVPDDSNDDFCCYDDGTEANEHNETSPNNNVVGSPPMLLSSNRSASRTPELLPAVEETNEENDKKDNKQLEYNLRKKSHASMQEFDDEEMAEYEEEGGRSGASSPANSSDLPNSNRSGEPTQMPGLRQNVSKPFWGQGSLPKCAFEVNAQVYSGRL